MSPRSAAGCGSANKLALGAPCSTRRRPSNPERTRGAGRPSPRRNPHAAARSGGQGREAPPAAGARSAVLDGREHGGSHVIRHCRQKFSKCRETSGPFRGRPLDSRAATNARPTSSRGGIGWGSAALAIVSQKPYRIRPSGGNPQFFSESVFLDSVFLFFIVRPHTERSVAGPVGVPTVPATDRSESGRSVKYRFMTQCPGGNSAKCPAIGVISQYCPLNLPASMPSTQRTATRRAYPTRANC